MTDITGTVNKTLFMKILLLGANGNLGSILHNLLLDKVDLVCLENYDIDLHNLNLLAEKIEDLKPTVIINTMAFNAVDKCEEDQEFVVAKLLNIEMPKVLAKISIKINATLVHYSSDYVFGGYDGSALEQIQKQGGFSENDLPKTNSRYSETKYLGELEILQRAKDGLKFYLIRTSKLFGPKGLSEFAKASFFDNMLELSRNRNELQVIDSETSCFTYTPDLAENTLKLIESEKEYGIYHIVNEGEATWFAGASVLFRLLKSGIRLMPVSQDAFPRPAKRPSYSVLKNTKLAPLRKYQEALKEYLQSK